MSSSNLETKINNRLTFGTVVISLIMCSVAFYCIGLGSSGSFNPKNNNTVMKVLSTQQSDCGQDNKYILANGVCCGEWL